MTKMKKKLTLLKKVFIFQILLPNFLMWWEIQRYFLSNIIDEIDMYHTSVIKKKLHLV